MDEIFPIWNFPGGTFLGGIFLGGIYRSRSNLYEKGNESLTNYKCWFDSNMLTLNAQKTHSVVFHRKQRKVSLKNCQLPICATKVTKVDFTKFFGVLINRLQLVTELAYFKLITQNCRICSNFLSCSKVLCAQIVEAHLQGCTTLRYKTFRYNVNNT